jgi:hypothetical protein
MGIGLTLQQLEAWQVQFSRMLRWRGRIVGAANGQPSADELDFLLAFFDTAHHLRDWLDETDTIQRAQLDAFISTHAELGICRDIANGFKHHTISRPSVDGEFAIVNQYADPEWLGRRYKFPNGEWTVLANGHQFGLVDLPERLIELWTQFLKTKGFVINSVENQVDGDRYRERQV